MCIRSRHVVLAVIGLLAIEMQPAAAADLPSQSPVLKAPAAAPLFDWTGLYVGVVGGVGRFDTQYSTDTAVVVGTDPSTRGLVGGTFGWNWQNGPWVVGVEADLSWSNLRAVAPPSCGVCESEMEWLGTVRGRLGVAGGNPGLLLYATGGVAYGGIKNTIGVASFSKKETGWVIGGGIEGRITPQWSAKLEFLHVRMDGWKNFCPTPICFANVSSDYARANIVQGGVNYHF